MKKISKADAVKEINSTDALEIISESIERSESAGSKQSKLNRFVAAIKKQIDDQRDLKIYSIKVR